MPFNFQEAIVKKSILQPTYLTIKLDRLTIPLYKPLQSVFFALSKSLGFSNWQSFTLKLITQTTVFALGIHLAEVNDKVAS